jgi:benzoyl-CoA reductase/2-hydroxyglutaryl-CoA dehydratase subunit BcrC/BadD/HgdB
MATKTAVDLFDELLAEPQNRLIDEAMAEGMVPVGYTCSFVPRALLSVDGIFPVRMRAPGVSDTGLADTYMSSVMCTYTRSLLEFAMDGRYDFLGGKVFTANCDHMRRLVDNIEYLRRPAFMHTLDVPHKRGVPAAEWFIGEIRVLSAALSAYFAVDTGTEALRKAIRLHNKRIAVLKEIADLRKAEKPVISGGEFHRLMLASLVTPWNLLKKYVEEFREKILTRNGTGNYRARVLVVGSELDDPSYVDVIESTGGLVVADRFCTGSIPELVPVQEEGDPLENIALHALGAVSCPRMMEDFDRRLSGLLENAREYRADGIVIEAIKFCDTWGVESSTLTSAIRQAGFHVLRLEREYRTTGEGQLRTRVQAFIESLGK